MEKKEFKKNSRRITEIILHLWIKNNHYCIVGRRGEDLLLALDKFLKKNKIDIRKEIFRLKLSFKNTGLISQRVAQAIVKGIITAKEWL